MRMSPVSVPEDNSSILEELDEEVVPAEAERPGLLASFGRAGVRGHVLCREHPVQGRFEVPASEGPTSGIDQRVDKRDSAPKQTWANVCSAEQFVPKIGIVNIQCLPQPVVQKFDGVDGS
jgi:hypothetical protein